MRTSAVRAPICKPLEQKLADVRNSVSLYEISHSQTQIGQRTLLAFIVDRRTPSIVDCLCCICRTSMTENRFADPNILFSGIFLDKQNSVKIHERRARRIGVLQRHFRIGVWVNPMGVV
jgi:hypothetical protein